VGLRQAGPRWGNPACRPVAAVAAEVSPCAAEQSGGGTALAAWAAYAKPAGWISINPAGRRERQSRQSRTVAACTGKHVQVWEPATGGTHGQVSPRLPMVMASGNICSQFNGNKSGPERGHAASGDLRHLHSWRGPGSVQPGHADAAYIAHGIAAARVVGTRVAGVAVTGQRCYGGADAAECESHNENPAHGPGAGRFRRGSTVRSTGPNGDTP
jgi:hypothetical protein